MDVCFARLVYKAPPKSGSDYVREEVCLYANGNFKIRAVIISRFNYSKAKQNALRNKG